MVAYNRISYPEDKSFSQYLICAKDYLEWINHTNRLVSMDVSGLNHIFSTGIEWPLHQKKSFQGCRKLEDHGRHFWFHHKNCQNCRENKSIKWTQVWWPTDINAINHSYNNNHRGSFSRLQDTYRNNQGNNYNSKNNSQNNNSRQSNNKEPVCYHCARPHYIIDCSQYQKDKDRYKHTTQQVKQSFLDKLKQGAKKNSININEAYFKNEEDTNPGNYSEEQTEELCKLLDTDSKWLNIREVHSNEVNDNTSPILYKVQIKDQLITVLFDTEASLSVISTKVFHSLKHKPKVLCTIMP